MVLDGFVGVGTVVVVHHTGKWPKSYPSVPPFLIPSLICTCHRTPLRRESVCVCASTGKKEKKTDQRLIVLSKQIAD